MLIYLLLILYYISSKNDLAVKFFSTKRCKIHLFILSFMYFIKSHFLELSLTVVGPFHQ